MSDNEAKPETQNGEEKSEHVLVSVATQVTACCCWPAHLGAFKPAPSCFRVHGHPLTSSLIPAFWWPPVGWQKIDLQGQMASTPSESLQRLLQQDVTQPGGSCLSS